MDIREVFVIVDGHQFTKGDVVHIIKEERYKHNFVFGRPEMSAEDTEKYMGKCDEVWCFGKVDNKVEYQIAKKINADIWVMG